MLRNKQNFYIVAGIYHWLFYLFIGNSYHCHHIIVNIFFFFGSLSVHKNAMHFLNMLNNTSNEIAVSHDENQPYF